jgi:predicted nucleic acid-binding Zn ribbon protein
MPTYTYRCEDGHEFEREQRITDPPLEFCPHLDFNNRGHERGGPTDCGALCKRLIPESTTFALKGKGWYKDGYSG